MNKPILYPIDAFDATTSKIIKYSYSGTQQSKNELIIKRSDNNIVVYNEQSNTFKLEHLIPPSILENGLSYFAEVIVYDLQGQASPVSDPVQFWCFTTPDFRFTNLQNNQIINDSNYELQIYYSQSEGELLREYHVTLYDGSHNELNYYQLYPTDLTCLLQGLLDGNQYYVKLDGVTINNMILSPSEIAFSVRYEVPSLFSIVELENIPLQGAVRIKSNVMIIEGESEPSPPVYIDGDKVDLTEDDSYVIFRTGFNIPNDFKLELVGENIIDGEDFLIMMDRTGEKIISLYKMTYLGLNGDKQSYVVLYAGQDELFYRTTSNFIPVLNDGEQVKIIVIRKDNYYDITIERV